MIICLEKEIMSYSTYTCPICGKHRFTESGDFSICPFCGWEDDGVQLDDPDFDGGANTLSLKQYRKEYRKLVQADSNYRWDKAKH